jgi:hypothetical protein
LDGSAISKASEIRLFEQPRDFQSRHIGLIPRQPGASERIITGKNREFPPIAPIRQKAETPLPARDKGVKTANFLNAKRSSDSS